MNVDDIVHRVNEYPTCGYQPCEQLKDALQVAVSQLEYFRVQLSSYTWGSDAKRALESIRERLEGAGHGQA